MKATAILFQLPLHPLYSKVDWDRISNGEYALVDPYDPAAILYLDGKTYRRYVMVFKSNDEQLQILAPAFSKPEVSSRPSVSRDTSNSSNYWVYSTPLLRVSNVFKSPMVTSGFELKDGLVVLKGGTALPFLRAWMESIQCAAGVKQDPTYSSLENHVFCMDIMRLLETRGVTYLILYLKSALIALNRFLAGDPIQDPWSLPVPVALRGGLPKIIPSRLRNKIRRSSAPDIRVWTSIFYMYKGIYDVHSRPDLSSLTDPGIVWSPKLKGFMDFCENHFWEWQDREKGKKEFPPLTIKQVEPYYSTKAGPNVSVSYLGYLQDALAWLYAPKNYILEMLQHFSAVEPLAVFRYVMREASKWYQGVTGYHIRQRPRAKTKDEYITTRMGANARYEDGDLSGFSNTSIPRLSKLAIKNEPSGKVRVFAIVDYWTQMVCKPLHDWMFKCLRTLPTDATFDQDGSLATLVAEDHVGQWAYDLKSATDRLPRVLYYSLFNRPMGSKLVHLWMRLLSDRPFSVPKWPVPTWSEFLLFHGVYRKGTAALRAQLMDAWLKWKNIKLWKKLSASRKAALRTRFNRLVRNLKSYNSSRVRYAVGQPMGALSSWASMALVHHALVQYAAFEVGKFPFYTYRILGDDLEISADREVAEQYLSVLTSFGVRTGGVKDYLSFGKFINFANQTYIGHVNVSPLSLVEELSRTNASASAERASRLWRRWNADMTGKGWVLGLIRSLASPHQLRRIVRSMTMPQKNKGVWDFRLLLTLLLGSTTLSSRMFGVTPFVALPRVSLCPPEVDPLRVLGRMRKDPLSCNSTEGARVVDFIIGYARSLVKETEAKVLDSRLHLLPMIRHISRHACDVDRVFMVWCFRYLLKGHVEIRHGRILAREIWQQCEEHYSVMLSTVTPDLKLPGLQNLALPRAPEEPKVLPGSPTPLILLQAYMRKHNEAIARGRQQALEFTAYKLRFISPLN